MQGGSSRALARLSAGWKKVFKQPSAFLLLPRSNLYLGDVSGFAGLRSPRGFFSPEILLISISSCRETLLF